jgi:ABC-2 type transport system permease protein
MFGLNKNKIDLLWQFVRTSFKMRYQNSLLGVLWVLIKPYLTFAVLFIIFSNFRGGSIPNFPLYLLIGIVFYTYINELNIRGQMSLLENAHIILKVNFPRQITILSSVINASINLFINFFLILFIALVSDVNISLTGILYILFISLIIFIFSTGLSMFMSILTIRYRDLEYILELFFQLFIYATPTFYLVDEIGGTAGKLISLNPIGIMLNQVRAAFGIYGEINLNLMLIYLAVSIVTLILGWMFFQSRIKKIAEIM